VCRRSGVVHTRKYVSIPAVLRTQPEWGTLFRGHSSCAPTRCINCAVQLDVVHAGGNNHTPIIVQYAFRSHNSSTTFPTVLPDCRALIAPVASSNGKDSPICGGGISKACKSSARHCNSDTWDQQHTTTDMAIGCKQALKAMQGLCGTTQIAMSNQNNKHEMHRTHTDLAKDRGTHTVFCTTNLTRVSSWSGQAPQLSHSSTVGEGTCAPDQGDASK
jgi:hypothetical protein